MKKRQTLCSFGCSWTAGVGAHYIPGMDESKFKNEAWEQDIIYPCSFRGILSKKFSLNNFNISIGGASNDYNFEQAQEIFGDPKRKQDFLSKNPIVLWGITSTARIYRKEKNIFLRPNRFTSILYFLEDHYAKNPSVEDLKLILQDQELLYISLYLKLYYDHDQEVRRLANLIETWNEIFAYHNVPVIWFDTFNTHKYYNNPRNFLPGGDLLSQMLKKEKIKYKTSKKWYHLSDWVDDDDRISKGVKNNLLNPFTFHPGQHGHQIIADILTPAIEQYL